MNNSCGEIIEYGKVTANMFEKSIDTQKGTLYYRIKEDKVTITTYHGNDTQVIVPERIEDVPVRKIGKKAFLNSRQLRQVILPDTLKKLGEWAFAYCGLLEKVELPKRRVAIGKGCFLGDKRLSEIALRQPKKAETSSWMNQSEKFQKDVAVLLAAVMTMEDAEYLLELKEAGKAEWMQKWDMRLLKTIDEPDEKGYTNMILCGEEDINCSLDNYIREKRKKKVRLCFLRLLHDSGLAHSVREQLETYLREHSVGQASMETWLVLKEERGHDRMYYELYVQLGCIHQGNYDTTLADLGSKHPEMKAYFMRQNADNNTEEDFFDSFSL